MSIEAVGNSFFHYLVTFSIWLFAFMLNRKQISYSVIGSSFLSLWFLMTLFSTFGFIGSDYSGYSYLYNLMLLTHSNVHVEPFYYSLIEILPNSYTFWRFVVWGLASFFYVSALKRMKVDSKFASFVVIVVLLFSTFYYLRNSLGFAVLCYAITFFVKPMVNKINSYIIAFLLIAISFSLHKSMIVYVMLFFLSIYPLQRKHILLSIILFPFLYFSITLYASSLLQQSFISEETVSYGEMYMANIDHISPTLFGWVDLAMKKLPIIFILYIGLKHLYFSKNQMYDCFFQYSYVLFYFSFLFLGQPVSFTLSDRLWVGGIFPLTIFIAYYFNNKRNIQLFRNSMILLIVSNLYTFLVTLIKAI